MDDMDNLTFDEPGQGERRRLGDGSPDMVLLHEGGMVVYANHVAASLLGASHAEDLAGRCTLDYAGRSVRKQCRTPGGPR
jgi:hypothetical protein